MKTLKLYQYLIIITFFILSSFILINAQTDIGQGLIYDKAAHPATRPAKPGYLATVTDPQFGTTIRRITRMSEQAPNAGSATPVYSTQPVWNADETYMILYQQAKHILLNGKTYAYIRTLSITPSDLEHICWHPTDPNFFFYPRTDGKFIKYDVRTNTQTVVRDFALDGIGAGFSLGTDPAYACSWDGKMWGFSNTARQLISYDMINNKLVTKNTSGYTQVCAPWPGPSGNKFWHYPGFTDHVEGEILDTNFNKTGGILMVQPYAHSCLGRLANGHDIRIGMVYDAPPAVGWIVMSDLDTKATTVIVGPDNGYPYPPAGHVSAFAFQKPGYVIASCPGDGQAVLSGEVVMADCNAGGKVYRVCHNFSSSASTYAVSSPSGTRIVFASDWGASGSTDTYVVELPAYTQTATERTNLYFNKDFYFSATGNSLAYYLPRNGNVKIALYNSIGSKIMPLVDAPMAAGMHMQNWNPNSLSAGVYFCHFSSGDITTVKKLSITK